MTQITQDQISTTLQTTKQLFVKVEILDFNLRVLGEITGSVLSGSINVSGNSDIRRTANIEMLVRDSGDEISAGNKIWLDKYLTIFTGIADIHSSTGDIVWTKHGIFMPNNPTITYNAGEKTISFEAVDLMAKLTGLRNGQIDGMPVTIKAGANIQTAVVSILNNFTEFSRYVVNVPPYPTVPNDINIDVGETVYDLLTKLRDVNPNWQFYFDTDGVFVFEAIPSGTEEQIFIDNSIWERMIIDYSLDTPFDKVKNYIEVIGKTNEVMYYTDTVVRSGNTYTATFPYTFASPITNGSSFGIKIPSVSNGVAATIVVKDKTGATIGTHPLKDGKGGAKNFAPNKVGEVAAIKYLNTEPINGMLDMGGVQPRAIKKMDNPLSPFYIGADFNAQYLGATNIYTQNVSIPQITNINQLLNKTFYIDIKDSSIDTVLKVNDFGAYPLYNKDSDNIAVGEYVITFTGNKYDIVGYQKGVGSIKHICVGGEYDNIYTEELAQVRANYELYKGSNLHNTMTLKCVPIYWLDVNKLTNTSFNIAGLDDAKWMIQSFNIDLESTGIQSVELIRFYPEYPPF